MCTTTNAVSLFAALALMLTPTMVGFANAAPEGSARPGDMSRSERPRPPAPQVVNGDMASAHRAESIGTVFLLGLILGMISGVGLFFLYLRRQQNKHARHDPSEYLFEDWPNRPARGLRDGHFGRGRRSNGFPPSTSAEEDFHTDHGDEMIEQPEPWERSVDWWKGEPEE